MRWLRRPRCLQRCRPTCLWRRWRPEVSEAAPVEAEAKPKLPRTRRRTPAAAQAEVVAQPAAQLEMPLVTEVVAPAPVSAPPPAAVAGKALPKLLRALKVLTGRMALRVLPPPNRQQRLNSAESTEAGRRSRNRNRRRGRRGRDGASDEGAAESGEAVAAEDVTVLTVQPGADDEDADDDGEPIPAEADIAPKAPALASADIAETFADVLSGVWDVAAGEIPPVPEADKRVLPPIPMRPSCRRCWPRTASARAATWSS